MDHRRRPRVRIARKDIGIGQGECATVFFDDLFDNRKAKSGPFVARRHIGFEQARAVFGQTDTIVRNRDSDAVAVLLHRDPDLWRITIGAVFSI